MDPAGDGASLCVIPARADAIALEFSEGQHQAQHQPAVICPEVELVLHGDQPPVRSVDAFDVFDGVAERAAEAVELGDDDSVA